MTRADHEVRLTWDGWTMREEFFCTAPETADCRQSLTGPECQCETIGECVRDHAGVIIGHLVEDGYTDGVAFHPQGPGECMQTVWLENSEETFQGPDIVLPRIPIEIEWQGDFYTWKAQQ